MPRKKKYDLPTKVARQASGPKPKIDLIKVLKFRAQGLTYKDIGALLKCNAHQIGIALGNLGKLVNNENGRLTSYRNHEADMLDSIRSRLMEAIGEKLANVEDAKKIDLQRLVWSFGVLMDKARLLRGESTTNIYQLTAIIEAAHKNHKAPSMVTDRGNYTHPKG